MSHHHKDRDPYHPVGTDNPKAEAVVHVDRRRMHCSTTKHEVTTKTMGGAADMKGKMSQSVSNLSIFPTYLLKRTTVATNCIPIKNNVDARRRTKVLPGHKTPSQNQLMIKI